MPKKSQTLADQVVQDIKVGKKETNRLTQPDSHKRKQKPGHRRPCLADKTNHPVKRQSLNRSQCGSCSTKYDTSAGT